METVHIDLDERSYPIVIAEDLLALGSTWQALPKAAAALIVTNEVVAPLYLSTLKQALRQEQELRLNKACLSIQKLLLIHILNCGKLYFNLILRLTKVLRMQYLFYV